MKNITLPLTEEIISDLKAGDEILLSGKLFTARDAAHKRMIENLERGLPLPFELKGQTIYYTGPCPAKQGEVIGPCGPTTSSRMDKYTPKLLAEGLSGMIGKGERSAEVVNSMIDMKAVYFGAIGGAGALISKSVISEKVIAWPELGPEAVREIKVINFPVIVIIDSEGNNLYQINRKKFRRI